MRLIAMSLYGKIEKYREPINLYSKCIHSILTACSTHESLSKNTILFPKETLNSKPLIIIVASSKGLCGGFNASLFRYIRRHLFIEEHQTPTFIAIGRKALTCISERYTPHIIYQSDEFSTNNAPYIAQHILTYITNDAPYSSVTVYHNRFKNFFTQVPHTQKITPYVPQHTTDTMPIDMHEEAIWEQSPQEILSILVKLYIHSTISQTLYESLIAEQAARFVAMDTATANAEKMLEQLTLLYNKSRQALITKELSELSASTF